MSEELETVVEDTVVETGALEVDVEGEDDFEVEIADDTPEAVYYTNLTLPTIYTVYI